jgi:membrane protease subunit HflC
MNKNVKGFLVLIVIGLLLLVLSSSVFILREDEVAIVQRFGRVEAVYLRGITSEYDEQVVADSANFDFRVKSGAGLYLKIPLIENVSRYSARLKTYAPPTRPIIASDKVRLSFDNVAQWRIDNPYLFFIRVQGSENTAMDRIDNILYSIMNEKVGKIDSVDLITNKDNVNDNMLRELIDEANAGTKEFGVTIVDVRIRRTDLPQENYTHIHERMRAERNSRAQAYRSDGQMRSVFITSQVDREVVEITSRAVREAEQIKGEGDSEAARIYADAYSRTPEFFEFYNVLETYRQTIGSQSILVVPINSPFARYLLSWER